MKERTNLKLKAKYLSPEVFEASGRRESAKGLTVSRSNSSLSLYSSTSAPSSPLTRKVQDTITDETAYILFLEWQSSNSDCFVLTQAMIRRSFSGERCIRPRSSIAALGTDYFSAVEDDDSPSTLG